MDKVPSKGGKPIRSIEFTLLSLMRFKAHFSALSAVEEVESSQLIHPFHGHLPNYLFYWKLNLTYSFGYLHDNGSKCSSYFRFVPKEAENSK